MGGGKSVYGSAETFEYGDLTATMEWLEKACANSNKKDEGGLVFYTIMIEIIIKKLIKL